MKSCHNCACDPVCDHNWNGWETCGNWIQKPEKPPTNADRIRAMSDEELAKWLEYEGGGVCAEVCGWMNWLQQPAEADI